MSSARWRPFCLGLNVLVLQLPQWIVHGFAKHAHDILLCEVKVLEHPISLTTHHSTFCLNQIEVDNVKPLYWR